MDNMNECKKQDYCYENMKFEKNQIKYAEQLGIITVKSGASEVVRISHEIFTILDGSCNKRECFTPIKK